MRDIRADGAPMVHQAPDRAHGWGRFSFSRFHQRPVTDDDLKAMIPDVRALQRAHRPAAIPDLLESRAGSPPYLVSLIYRSTVDLPPDQIAGEFTIHLD